MDPVLRFFGRKIFPRQKIPSVRWGRVFLSSFTILRREPELRRFLVVKRLQAGDLARSIPQGIKLTVAGPLRNTSNSTSPDSPSISCPCDGLPKITGKVKRRRKRDKLIVDLLKAKMKIKRATSYYLITSLNIPSNLNANRETKTYQSTPLRRIFCVFYGSQIDKGPQLV